MARRVLSGVVAHLPALRRYARVLTRDPVCADDLVQQALLRAHEKAHLYQPGRALRPWLLAILHNVFIDNARRQRAEHAALQVLAEDVTSSHPGEQEGSALLREVIAGFARLPDSQRAVLHLVAIEGLTYQEAAEALGVRVGTIMSRLSRARATLRHSSSAPGSRPFLWIAGGKDAE
jgi:RNA polymerase sigma-70 factor, ECF subfamily